MEARLVDGLGRGQTHWIRPPPQGMSLSARPFGRTETRVMAQIKGHRIFLTGAGGGMGRCIAAMFAKRGATLGLTDSSERDLGQTIASLGAEAGISWSRVLDVTDASAVDAAVRGFAAEAGGLDLVVNAAGILAVAKVVDMDPAEWRRVLE